ncbi:transposase, partial [Lysinibacillus sp. ZYM-1]
MMTKNQINEREQLEMLTIDQLVPEDHLVRKLEAAIDFSFIYPLVENFYSAYGRPSIDPVVLFKMTFIQYVFGIRSMRQTIKEIETNMAYRWFLGFGFHTEV